MQRVSEVGPRRGLQEQTVETTAPIRGMRTLSAAVALASVMGTTSCVVEMPPATTPVLRAAPEAQPPACGPLPDTATGWARGMIDGSNWLTGDGVFAQTLPDGRAVVFTSDNMGGNPQDGYRFNRNAMVVFCGNKAQSAAPHGNVIPSNKKGEWFWPVQSLIKADKMYVLASRNIETGGDFGFRHTGAEIAVFKLPSSTAEAPAFERMIPMPTSYIPEVGPNGKHNIHMAASMVEKDGNLYLFGGHVYDAPLSFGRNVHVARVPLSKVESAKAWRYWTGTKWGSSIVESKPIIDTHEQEGQDSAWTTFVAKDGRFTMIGKKDGWFGDQIGMWTAKSPHTPQGPYTYRKLAGKPIVRPHRSEDCRRSYSAFAHPDIVLKSGKMLVTLNNNVEAKPELAAIINNPGDFAPQWIEVPTNPNDERAPVVAPQLQPTASSCTRDYGYKPPVVDKS